MSPTSLPQSTPKWLRDLKQGRGQTKGAARDATSLNAVAEPTSGRPNRTTEELHDRLSAALPGLHRRAVGLADDLAEAAWLTQLCCLGVLSASSAEGKEPGASAPADRFDDLLLACWDKLTRSHRARGQEPSRVGGTRCNEAQKMPVPAGGERPCLGQILQTFTHLERDQPNALATLARLVAADDTSDSRAVTGFHRLTLSDGFAETEIPPPLPRGILLALLMPFLDTDALSDFARDDVSDVLSRSVTRLRQELAAPGGRLPQSERGKVLLVLALMRWAVPDQVLFGAAPGRDELQSFLLETASGRTSEGGSEPGPTDLDACALRQAAGSPDVADGRQATAVRPAHEDPLALAYSIVTATRLNPQVARPFGARRPRSTTQARIHAN